MTERNYYTIFKRSLDLPIVKFFSKLDLQDWIELFNDYYRHELTYLLRIFDVPKGEDIYSYGLIWVNNVSPEVKELITKSNNKLLSDFIIENNSDLLNEIFKAIRYLKLDVNKELLFQIVSNRNAVQKTRELAAATLIVVHENSVSNFWDNLDLEKDHFLIPAYIAFHRKSNPVKGLKKLLLISERPKNIAPFETPIVYSLLQISTSSSSIQDFKLIQPKLPSWVTKFIKELYEDYPELYTFKDKVQKPYEDILMKIGLDNSVWEDLATQEEDLTIRNSLELLLDKIKKRPDVLRIVNQDKYSVISPEYIDSMSDIIEELQTIIYAKVSGNYHEPPKEPVFDIPENSIYYDNPSIFLYPYFLDSDRTEKAGVIPYANQRAIAIIIHKDNKQYKEWIKLRTAVQNRLSADERATDLLITEIESKNWLIKLVEDIYNNNGQIHTIRGYVFHSIIKQFVIKNIENDEALGQVLKAPTDLSIVKEKLEFFQQPKVGTSVSKNSILLLDPSDAFKETENGQAFMPSLNTNFRIITVKHGLEIPVGIGYSLFALPRLLEKSNWKTLKEFMLNKLSGQREKFIRVGIELLPTQSTKAKTKNIQPISV